MNLKHIPAATLFMLATSGGFAQPPSPAQVERGLPPGTAENGLTVNRGRSFAAPSGTDGAGAFATGQYRNLFADVGILLLATRLDGYVSPRLSVVEVAESQMNTIG